MSKLSKAFDSYDHFCQKFPDLIDIFRKGLTYDYESNEKGLGYSVGYTSPYSQVTIYAYDNGISEFPKDIEDQLFKNEFLKSIDDVFRFRSQDLISIKLMGKNYLEFPGFFTLYFAPFVIERMNHTYKSELYLTPYENMFLKFRISYSMEYCESHSYFIRKIIDLI